VRPETIVTSLTWAIATFFLDTSPEARETRKNKLLGLNKIKASKQKEQIAYRKTKKSE